MSANNFNQFSYIDLYRKGVDFIEKMLHTNSEINIELFSISHSKLFNTYNYYVTISSERCIFSYSQLLSNEEIQSQFEIDFKIMLND